MRRILALVVVGVVLMFGATSPAFAAIVPTHINSESNSANGTTDYVTTFTLSPTANTLVTAAVAITGSAVTNPSTGIGMTGCGMTWGQAGSGGSSVSAVVIFRSISASPGTACALTVTTTGTRDGIAIYVTEWSGTSAAAGDNGAASIIQQAGNTGASNTSPVDVTLSAFGDATNNAGFEACLNLSSSTSTFAVDATATWAQISTTVVYTAPATSFAIQYKVGQDTTASCGWSSTAVKRAVAIEIASATVGGGGPPAGSLGLLGVGK